MKITVNNNNGDRRAASSAANSTTTATIPTISHLVKPPATPDLASKPTFPPPRRPNKPTRRKIKTSPKRVASRPETPLLKWKFQEQQPSTHSLNQDEEDDVVDDDDKDKPYVRKCRRKIRPPVISSRKLGASLWRLHLSEFQTTNLPNRVVGLLQEPGGGDHFGRVIHCPHVKKTHTLSTKDVADDSPRSVSGPKNSQLLHTFEPLFQFSNSAMEGATKWDPIGWKASDEPKQVFSHQPKQQLDQRAKEKISALEAELEHARAKITDLENDRRSSKKKLEQFLQKLSEERAAWRSREHEKIRAVIDDMKAEMNREKKNRQRLEIVNSKLLHELTDAKMSAKRYLQEYEKERKARELIEDVCDELAKEIEEDKAEAEALKRESSKVFEEVEEERKMLQMAEVWREERVQMKLVDAKVMLEEKYTHMNRIIEDLQCFLNSRTNTTNLDLEETKKAELLCQVAASSVNMKDIREMTYEPPNSDDMYSVFEDVNFAESHNREEMVIPEVKQLNKASAERQCDSNMYMDDQSDEAEEDGSEWETVSHQGSSYSPDGGSSRSFQASNVSRNGGSETPIVEINEVGTKQLKKMSSSISRLWRSYPSNGDNDKIRLSNGSAIVSSDCGSGKDGFSVDDLGGEWSSPESGHPHMNRGMKGGCIEWPRGTQKKGSLKSRLMEARVDSQKIQLRQVLKHKI